ncbi:MAG: hypothetical protein AAFR17_16165 [Pseudomonadota bacterium]
MGETDDISQAERMINHTHVFDLFGYAEEASEEEFILAARLLQQSWGIALARALPEARFDISLATSEREYGPVVTFCRVR